MEPVVEWGRIMSKVIPRGGLYEYTEYATRTHIRNTHRDRRRTFAVGGVYVCRERRGDAATREAPHGGGPQRAIRLADLFYRRPRRNDARASLWSSARRARASGRPRAARVAPTLTHESATAVCRFLSGRPDR